MTARRACGLHAAGVLSLCPRRTPVFELIANAIVSKPATEGACFNQCRLAYCLLITSKRYMVSQTFGTATRSTLPR